MFILKLRLVGYKRLMLNNINEFEYTPTSPYQIILGTNGSGKSSILGELTPLPAEAKDFIKDGYKEIHIAHAGSEYILISTFKSGNKHQFLKDGNELNPGGTLTVQREIVRREFGIWGELHDLLMGRERFTIMSPSKRREWITSLSSADYTYAIKVFDRLKGQARDTQGALKHDKLRLTQETQNLSALGDLSEVRDKCTQWKEELNALLLSRPARTRTSKVVDQELESLCSTVERIGLDLLGSIPTAPSNYSSLQDVQDHITRVTQEISSVQSLLEHYGSEYKELEEITVALEGETLDIGALETKYRDFQTAIHTKRAGIQHFQHVEDPESILTDLSSALPSLVELFESLPDNSERVFTKDAIEKAREALTAARRDQDLCQNRLALIDTKLEHMQQAKNEECPKCGYIWKPGYSEQEEREYISSKRSYEEGLGKAKKEIVRLEDYLEQAGEYTRRFMQFKQLTQSYPRLKTLWDEILEKNYHLDHPRSRISFFYMFQQDVSLLADIDRLEKDAAHLLELLERDKVRRGEGSVRFEERLARLKESIERTTEKLRGLTREQTQARTYHAQAKRWWNNFAEMDKASAAYPGLYSERIDVERCKYLDQATATHQSKLAIAENKITQQITLQGIVADLEKSHDKLSQNSEAYKALLKALSPTEGLIADQLNGFIACITAQLNSVIASVWSYDMQILPCGNESGELDYKFPMQVHTSIGSVPDVSLGSTAQQEIVDFAFKITVMLYLGMREYPLYLDELGASFDEQHRINVMQFVKRLVDTGYHRQVYLVSHYAASHGAFTNAEVLVMDPRNIAVPKEHNKHVTMA